MNKKSKQTIALLITVIAGIGIFKISQHHYLSLEQLNMHKHHLIKLVNTNYIASAAAFIASYILFAALMLPGAFILSLAGGLLFGVFWGSIYVTIGATFGAFCAFIATRYFIGSTIQNKYNTSLARFNKAIDEYGAAYLFIVRLLPIFPFFLVNLLAGLSTVSSKTFLVTTALGILPLVVGFTYLGSQLRYTETIEDIFSYPLTIAGLLLLGMLILHTIAKKWRNNHTKPASQN